MGKVGDDDDNDEGKKPRIDSKLRLYTPLFVKPIGSREGR